MKFAGLLQESQVVASPRHVEQLELQGEQSLEVVFRKVPDSWQEEEQSFPTVRVLKSPVAQLVQFSAVTWQLLHLGEQAIQFWPFWDT